MWRQIHTDTLTHLATKKKVKFLDILARESRTDFIVPDLGYVEEENI